MIDAFTSTYTPEQVLVYQEGATVVVKRLHTSAWRPIIFGARDITKYTVTIRTVGRPNVNRDAWFMAGWSAQSRVKNSMTSYFGDQGWNGIGQTMTTQVNFAAEEFIFEINGRIFKTSFSTARMAAESEEDPQFYPALSMNVVGDEIV